MQRGHQTSRTHQTLVCRYDAASERNATWSRDASKGIAPEPPSGASRAGADRVEGGARSAKMLEPRAVFARARPHVLEMSSRGETQDKRPRALERAVLVPGHRALLADPACVVTGSSGFRSDRPAPSAAVRLTPISVKEQAEAASSPNAGHPCGLG